MRRRVWDPAAIVAAVAILAWIILPPAPAEAVTKKREARWVHNHPAYKGGGGGGKLHVLAPATADSDCITHQIGPVPRWYKEWFGVRVTAWRIRSTYTWSFHADGTLCSASHFTVPWVAGWSFWQWEGWDYHVTGKGTNADGVEYRYYRDQGTYKFCAAWFFPVCIYKHPWVAATLRGDGTFYYSADAGSDWGTK